MLNHSLFDLNKLSSRVVEVGVLISRIRSECPTSDNAHPSLLVGSGAIGSLYASFCVRNGDFYPHDITLHYERATIRVTVAENRENGECIAKMVSLQTLGENGQNISKHVRFTEAESIGHYQWDKFKALVSGSNLEGEIAPEQVAKAVRVINAMAESEKSHQNVIL